MKKITKRDIGKLCTIKFLDHSISKGTPLENVLHCEAMGEIVVVDRDVVRLRYWCVIHDDKDTRDANDEFTTVVKKAIVDVCFLKRI